jgi:hypothetical protein
MKYVIVVNDGQSIFHLGSNAETDITTRGIYYSLMSLPIESDMCFPQTELIKKLNFGLKNFNKAVGEFAALNLSSTEKNGKNEYICIYNSEHIREDSNAVNGLDMDYQEQLNALAESIARTTAYYYQLGYTDSLKYRWYHSLKSANTKLGLNIDVLANAVNWIVSNINDLKVDLSQPRSFVYKWGAICRRKTEMDGKVKRKGTAYL